MKKEEQLKNLIARVQKHPDLEERIEAILDIMENTSGEFITADQTEEKAIEEVQKLGQELLRRWAFNQQDKSVEIAKKTHPNVEKHGKKLYWQTRLGRIEIEEIIMKHKTLVGRHATNNRIAQPSAHGKPKGSIR